MTVSRDGSDDKALWNGPAGQAWVAASDALDAMFQPFEDLLVETATTKSREWVLDVGCGTGSTTIALEKALGPGCQCVGVDISAPMLEHARARAEREGASVSFLLADAERHAFERARFDLIVSRFGVMFFEDSVRAFENLRRAARDGAELCLVVWRGPEENPFMTAAERAAATVLPNVPAREPDAPGQFGFANPSRVSRILKESGWNDVVLSPIVIHQRRRGDFRNSGIYAGLQHGGCDWRFDGRSRTSARRSGAYARPSKLA
jgi:SAM-dependent methyltransferase